jgi:Fe2+ transport system protein FeoA
MSGGAAGGPEAGTSPGARAPTRVSLADLPRGGRGRVASVSGSAGTTQRLLEMGLTAGALVEVVRFAPLRDPIEVAVRGYRLSLRRADAAGVLVEVL